MVFVGENVEMKCDGPQNSKPLYIRWIIISGVIDTLIVVCSLETNGSCEDSDGNILDVQNSYNTSSFTIENVSLEDAKEYECEIRTFDRQKLCRFNVTIKGAYAMHSFFSSNVII